VSLLLFWPREHSRAPKCAAAILRGSSTHPKPFTTRAFGKTLRGAGPGSPSRPPVFSLFDDDPETTQTFARMLKLEGYDVAPRSRGGGLRAVESQRAGCDPA